MIEVTKEFKFEAAHLLADHPGKCRNLHGHSYRLFVTVTGGLYDDMVVDFSDLKALVEECVIEPFDHAFIYNFNSTDPFERELIDLTRKHKRAHIGLAYRATCERMCVYIFRVLRAAMEDKTYKVTKIRLYETATSYCDYSEGCCRCSHE